MNKIQKLTVIPAMTAIMLIGGGIAGYAGLAAAQTTPTASASAMTNTMPTRSPHVDGTITAINGSTVTITSAANHGGGTFTIDASGATVTKAGATATLADFAVGNTIWAEGTITGTNVVATKISDRPGMGMGFGRGGFGGRGKGMGGRGVMGQVTAVNGSTITVTGKDGTSYTVNADGATVHKMVTEPVSDITVGDTIGVQGTVSGTTVTAKSIMDGVPQAKAQSQ